MKINFPKLFRRLFRIIAVLVVLYSLTLVFFYFKQEKFFFNPKHLEPDYIFQFEEPFEELEIAVEEDVYLNALHFKATNPKGIILYFHGNAGAIHDWGKRAPLYLENEYDVLFVDYRGYGKSDGNYKNEDQLFSDVQKVYDYVKSKYDERQITVLGYSLGSGLAAYVASQNNPKQLILNAPYYSWKTLVADEIAPPIPTYLIKYDIKTYAYLATVQCPIQIFHGTKDFLIRPNSNSEKLKELYPDKIDLTLIIDAVHNDIHITKQYYDALKELL
ncbi:alpha/beta fold hydrolase [Dokdonia sp.]|uniref:alpha/beta hydrolase n=1 Tax=Dokdonia sp. TaxID=2024995 RepID=UPI0032661C35